MFSCDNEIYSISSFEQWRKTYRFCGNKNIEQTEFAYRQKENKMEQNKNQLREESIEFAIAVSDTCDNIKGCSVYVNQLLRSSSSIGENIHEANL